MNPARNRNAPTQTNTTIKMRRTWTTTCSTSLARPVGAGGSTSAAGGGERVDQPEGTLGHVLKAPDPGSQTTTLKTSLPGLVAAGAVAPAAPSRDWLYIDAASLRIGEAGDPPCGSGSGHGSVQTEAKAWGVAEAAPGSSKPPVVAAAALPPPPLWPWRPLGCGVDSTRAPTSGRKKPESQGDPPGGVAAKTARRLKDWSCLARASWSTFLKCRSFLTSWMPATKKQRPVTTDMEKKDTSNPYMKRWSLPSVLLLPWRLPM
mmetsp:Transcript_80351/g.202174  ORF Transcript_80351/g.202174 Transcript_80351/m.202174 type:complete len:261 (-) Transcript_80351:152-934(-)